MSTAMKNQEVSVIGIGKCNNIEEALSALQKKLKVPKERFNKFANYPYRNAEDILAAVKDIMPEGAYVLTNDKIELIGERHYIMCSAYFCYNGEKIQSNGYAREPLLKKGSDESQITGATSSYAKKYALNGLFAIDDSIDADGQDNREAASKKSENAVAPISTNLSKLKHLISAHGLQDKVAPWLISFNVKKLSEIPEDGLVKILQKVKEHVATRESANGV